LRCGLGGKDRRWGDLQDGARRDLDCRNFGDLSYLVGAQNSKNAEEGGSHGSKYAHTSDHGG